MRNRRKAVVVLLAVLLVAGVAYWTSPRVLFDDADSLQIHRITAAGAAGCRYLWSIMRWRTFAMRSMGIIRVSPFISSSGG